MGAEVEGSRGGDNVEGAEVVLGFIPASLVTKLTDEEGQWRAVPAAAEELCAVIRGLSEPQVEVLLAKLDPFLRMLTALLRETQFRSVMALLKTVEVSRAGLWDYLHVVVHTHWKLLSPAAAAGCFVAAWCARARTAPLRPTIEPVRFCFVACVPRL